ncbi:hypothetical protein FSARC_479 [Fusarium sarcochroum]|uniref:Uncharacterized protein n=1 Tax=Fusarium sarcochroum TaxID=1208366 RepID=A0A8H4UBH6_9HYPO|nr:hypothetical protein FSARC_479 [Fusarium sarcochroum]
MLSQTPSRPRGRPPGRRNKPRESQEFPQNIMSDEQIRINLGRSQGKSSSDSYVGGACRTIFKITNQYPWEWATGFAPRKWTIDVVRHLRNLIKGFSDKTQGNNHINTCQEVKNWLRAQASKRDMHAPQLTEDDLQDALKYFMIETKTRAKASKKTTETGPSTSALEVVGVTYHDDEEDDTESSLFIDDDLDEHFAQDHDQDNKSSIFMSSNEATPGPPKRSGSPHECSQAHKRARLIQPQDADVQPDTAMSNDITVSQETSVSKYLTTANDTCLSRFVPDTSYRPESITDLINGSDHLRSKKEKEKEHITRALTELRASMQAKENCMTPSTAVNHAALDKLRRTVRKYKETKEEIKSGKDFFEQHHQDLAVGAAVVASYYHNYKRRLRDCDELIKQTQLQIQEKLKKAAQNTSGIKAQLEKDMAETLRLEARELEIVQYLEYYHVIGSLMKLGPPGSG